jgi:hypothetical protein
MPRHGEVTGQATPARRSPRPPRPSRAGRQPRTPGRPPGSGTTCADRPSSSTTSSSSWAGSRRRPDRPRRSLSAAPGRRARPPRVAARRRRAASTRAPRAPRGRALPPGDLAAARAVAPVATPVRRPPAPSALWRDSRGRSRGSAAPAAPAPRAPAARRRRATPDRQPARETTSSLSTSTPPSPTRPMASFWLIGNSQLPDERSRRGVPPASVPPRRPPVLPRRAGPHNDVPHRAGAPPASASCAPASLAIGESALGSPPHAGNRRRRGPGEPRAPGSCRRDVRTRREADARSGGHRGVASGTGPKSRPTIRPSDRFAEARPLPA